MWVHGRRERVALPIVGACRRSVRGDGAAARGGVCLRHTKPRRSARTCAGDQPADGREFMSLCPSGCAHPGVPIQVCPGLSRAGLRWRSPTPNPLLGPGAGGEELLELPGLCSDSREGTARGWGDRAGRAGWAGRAQSCVWAMGAAVLSGPSPVQEAVLDRRGQHQRGQHGRQQPHSPLRQPEGACWYGPHTPPGPPQLTVLFLALKAFSRALAALAPPPQGWQLVCAGSP